MWYVRLDFGINYKSICQPLEVATTSAPFSYSLGVTPGFLRSSSSSTWLPNSAIRFEVLERCLRPSLFTFYNFSQNSKIYSCLPFPQFLTTILTIKFWLTHRLHEENAWHHSPQYQRFPFSKMVIAIAMLKQIFPRLTIPTRQSFFECLIFYLSKF